MSNGKLNFNNDEKDSLLRDIYRGVVSLFSLPFNLYTATGQELTEGVYKGYKVPNDIDIQQPDYETPKIMKKNVYEFSAAKTFQQVRDIQNFMFKDGVLVPFEQFEKAAGKVFDIYNRNWLLAEYNTSLRMAESARDWEQIMQEADIFPLLRYETVLDGKVREEHRTLHGIVRKVNDPFWNKYFPPNGWNCRCTVQQLQEGKETNLSKKNIEEINPLFEGNAGKRKTVFKKTHPYWMVPKDFKEFKKANFGLPLPPDVL